MKTSVFQFIVDLEGDIARFYEKLKSLSRMKNSVELFDFMSEHSTGHGSRVKSLEAKYEKPELDQQFFRRVHEQIKESLFEEIRQSGDDMTALQKIARAEELTGKLYGSIAGHYRKLSEYYSQVAREIDAIAEEEFQHRDMVTREVRKYRDQE